MDLEIQISAPSVDQLKALEVRVASVLPEPSKPASAPSVKRWVEPRDARSAGLSYDGREGDARGLTTLPPVLDESLAPRVLPSPWAKGEFYVEIAHPQDTSRRITESSRFSSLGHTTRYGLFGHDLERGVVLRARLRGLWIESDAPEAESLRRLDRFLREPLPLGI